MLSPVVLLLAALAALAAGFVNALAGGGTLITFPTLLALGLPPVTANVTSTLALCPGYFGATWAQRRDLAGQRARLQAFTLAAVLGGACGAALLLATGDKFFGRLAPYLILFAVLVLGLQEPLKRWLGRAPAAPPGTDSSSNHAAPHLPWPAAAPVFFACIYGGYFGAGMSVVVLAVLGLWLSDSLTRLNALKQSIALATNLAAAVFFALRGPADWPAAGVMAIGSLAGGFLGGRCAGLIPAGVLRVLVCGCGAIVALVMLVRG